MNVIPLLICLLSWLLPPAFAISAADEINYPESENFLLNTGAQKTAHRMFSLRAAFDKADRENKEILIASSGLPVSRAAIVIAKAIPNPTFSMTYGFGNSYEYIIAGNGHQFGWSEEIQVAGKRTKKIDVANANYVQQAFQVAAVQFDVHNRVRRAYSELAAAHAYADVIEAQRDIAMQLLDISRKRFQAGKAPGSEVLQARLAVMQFDAQRNQAWGRIIQDTAQLSLLLGEAPSSEDIIDVEENGLFRLSAERSVLTPSPARPLPPLLQLLPAAWRERNDLKVAVQNAFADRKALTLAKSQRIPDPTVGFQYFFSTYKRYQFGFFDPAGVIPYLQSIYPTVPQLYLSPANPTPPAKLVTELYDQSITSGAGLNAFNSGTVNSIPNITQDRVPFQPGYQVTAQQETPIFYQYQGQINQAKATWVQQLRQNDQLRAQIAADIVTAYEELVVATANIKKHQEQILPVAARVAEMTREGYRLGKMDLATTMLAQQQYAQLLSAYFDAVVAYQNAWSDLEKAIGVPLNL